MVKIKGLTLAIIRGEAPLSAITKMGVDIYSENGFYILNSRNFDVSVMPSAYDVAMGILRYSSGNKDDIRKWSFFLLAESGAIDFSVIESHPQGDTLIGALWDASFEGRFCDETIKLARDLTSG